MTDRNQKINYIELPASDLDATKRFYGEAFGWTFVDYGPQYIAFNGAGIDGGFTLEAEAVAATDGGVQRGALVVLYADDLETTESRVQSLGGTILKPIFSFPGGRRFHFSDPCGNELAVWSE